MARVGAIDYYTKECGFVIPKNASFNEVCIEEPGFLDGKWKVYVRLAVRMEDCAFSKWVTRNKIKGEIVQNNSNYELLEYFQHAKSKGWF